MFLTICISTTILVFCMRSLQTSKVQYLWSSYCLIEEPTYMPTMRQASVCQCLCLSVYQCVRLSACQCVCLCDCLFICKSVSSLSVGQFLSMYLSTCLSVNLSDIVSIMDIRLLGIALLCSFLLTE